MNKKEIHMLLVVRVRHIGKDVVVFVYHKKVTKATKMKTFKKKYNNCSLSLLTNIRPQAQEP